MKKPDTEFILVECVQHFRIRYVVEVPKGEGEWALDTVTMEQAKEFSQSWLGETIVSHRPIKKKKIIELFDQDNGYLKDWDDEMKLQYVTTIKDKENYSHDG